MWEPLAEGSPALVVRTTRDSDPAPLIEEFLAVPFRLEEEPPLRQLLASAGDPPRWSLITHVHHAATDLVGALLFVRRQLRVAAGTEVARPSPQWGPPKLRPAPHRPIRNPGFRVSTPLATFSGPASAARRWRTLSVSREPFGSLSRPLDGFTWNDVLLAAALEALAAWNDRRRAPSSRIGLWVPMNIRQEPLRGFGNGASRIRIHRDPIPRGATKLFIERCRAVRRAVERKKRAGEWALPFLQAPAPLVAAAAPLLRRWLDRPWADFGTAGFTHLERWPGAGDPVLAGLSGIEVVACLHRRHPLYFVAMSLADRTLVTITWDPALLRSLDIEAVAAAFMSPLTDRRFGARK